VPHALRLAPDAKKLWIRFYNDWAGEQAAAEGEMAAALAKLEAYAARFALLHHVVTCVGLEVDDQREVGTKSIEAGIALCHWFANEARRIYATLSESTEERDARRLVEWIQARGGKVTVKELQHSNNRKYPTADEAAAALNSLTEVGAARWEDRPPGPRGGRPTRVCVLSNPGDETDQTDETPPEGEDGEGGLPTEPPDDTSPPSNGTPGIPEKSEVSSVSSCVVQGACPLDDQPGEDRPTPEVSSCGLEVSSCGPSYQLVTDPVHLGIVNVALDESALVAIDVETTGLDPRRDRARLLTLATDRGVFILDCFAVAPSPLWDVLAEKEIIGHNLSFDLSFLAKLGFTPGGRIHDTMLMARMLGAGSQDFYHSGLAECVARELGKTLDKSAQKSNWSGRLTTDQLAYAADDAAVLVPLYQALRTKIDAAKLAQALEIEERALPGFVWLSGAGVPFDSAAWQALANEAAAEAEDLTQRLDDIAPVRDGHFAGASAWDWNSPQQVKDALEAAGCVVESTEDEALAALDHPLASLIRQYRAAMKRVGTYGKDWLSHVDADGRVFASWNQLGSVAGRTSCSEPNLQQVPRDPRYRACFRAPDGRVLVKADYSQLQLRIAAKIANEKHMLAAYARGEDLHTLTAKSLAGKAEVTKQDRQLAKAVNFGLLFGLGAKGLRGYARSNYGLEPTEAEAKRYRQAFFAAYPGLAAWHKRAGNSRAQECRTLANRRRLLDEKTPYTHRLNTPVQGTEADGAKLALALLWERRSQAPGAFPVLFVHDEIVVECDHDQADAVSAWLRQDMLDGMADWLTHVPVEVEVRTASAWGG
jgi:DNA polymerase-1